MHLYFIRHAQSENNALWAETNSTEGRSHDPELTPTGHEQARLLAGHFQAAQTNASQDGHHYPYHHPARITHIYCSLMIRAVATGDILARALGLPLVGMLDIHETGGIYQRDPRSGEKVGLPGPGKAFFAEHYPSLALPESMNPHGWWNRPFEEPAERPPRAGRVIEYLLATHGGTDHRVALISHGGFYDKFMKTLLGMQMGDEFWFTLNNTGITLIHFGEEVVQLTYSNRIDYLPDQLIT